MVSNKNDEIIFPDWIPEPCKEIHLVQRDLPEAESTHEEGKEKLRVWLPIQERLLTRPDMEQAWRSITKRIRGKERCMGVLSTFSSFYV